MKRNNVFLISNMSNQSCVFRWAFAAYWRKNLSREKHIRIDFLAFAPNNSNSVCLCIFKIIVQHFQTFYKLYSEWRIHALSRIPTTTQVDVVPIVSNSIWKVQWAQILLFHGRLVRNEMTSENRNRKKKIVKPPLRSICSHSRLIESPCDALLLNEINFDPNWQIKWDR